MHDSNLATDWNFYTKCVDNYNTCYPFCHLHNLVSHSVGKKENAFDLDGFHITLIYSSRSITEYGLTQPFKLLHTASLSFGSAICFQFA